MKHSIAFLLALIAPLLAQVSNDAKPVQGADLLKTDLLVVLAHPDDETGMAATLATYAHGLDKRIAAVYCTRGEGGGNMVGTHWGKALGVLREAELQECLRILGVQRTYFCGAYWGYGFHEDGVNSAIEAARHFGKTLDECTVVSTPEKSSTIASIR